MFHLRYDAQHPVIHFPAKVFHSQMGMEQNRTEHLTQKTPTSVNPAQADRCITVATLRR